MRLATLSLMVALLYGPALRAQNQTLILPGDILIVKILSGQRVLISKTVAVTPDGTIKPPPLRADEANEEISVSGMGLDDATHKLQQSYTPQRFKALIGASVFRGAAPAFFQVTIERGTVDELLRQ